MEYFMGIEQYRVEVSFNAEKQAYVAKVPELPLMPEVTAETRAEAIAKLDEAIEIGAKLTIEQEGQLPTAIDTDDSFSGHIELDIGKSLHKDLAFKAKREGIDLDKLIISALSAFVNRGRPAAGLRKARDEKRDENIDGNSRSYEGRRYYNPREGSDAYRTLMEDGASFREFLRQQERGARPMRRRRNNNNNNTAATSSNNNSEQ